MFLPFHPSSVKLLLGNSLQERELASVKGAEFTDSGRPNMGPLNKYDAFLILVTAPVSCVMPIGP